MAGPAGLGHGVADMHVGQGPDLGHQVADLARAKLGARSHAGAKLAQLDDIMLGALAHQADFLPLEEPARHDADIDDHALVGIEMAVVNQGLERLLRRRPAAAARAR